MNSVGSYGPEASKTLTSGSAPPPAPPKTFVRVIGGTWHSCTQGPGENTSNFAQNPMRCGGVVSPGGDVDIDDNSKWLDRADGWVEVTGCGDQFYSWYSDWYVMSTGPQAGRAVNGPDVEVRDENGGSLRCG